MSTNSLTNDELPAGEDVLLGNKTFAFVKSPGKLTIFDPEKKQGLDLYGNLDSSSIKKDLMEVFNENYAFSVTRIDIAGHISSNQSNNNDIYRDISKIERHNNPPIIEGLKSYKKIEQKTHESEFSFERELEIAKKAGYVQGVCECVAIVGDYQNMGKKLLSEMNVTKDMAKKFANPDTYKTLEKGIFAQKQEQKLEQSQGMKR